MTRGNQSYYFSCRVYYKNTSEKREGYWPFNLYIGAKDLVEASKIFYAWACGIMVCADNVTLDKVTTWAEEKSVYYLPNDPILRERVRMFLDGHHRELSELQERDKHV